VTSAFQLEALADGHDRKSFTSGEEALDRYFQTQVTQDVRRRIAACFVALERATGNIAAFYTIAAASIPTPDLPAEITKRLPRYPTLPAVRIGRLAVDSNFRGRGLGAALLADAIRRVLIAPPAIFAVIVDAKDDDAVAFYQHHGFQALVGHERTLFLPVATAQKFLL
jgi:GNAT superfamily N-acetyltransferase